ncbi:MAG: class II fumarate hydratase, partial [Thermoleophilia bacterium]|nr:class II fumarate hydratase [Thermoleophilia bacterium]
MTETRAVRVETDSMGQVEVPADRYWGAQTQRALVYFAIGEERMPLAVIRALGLIKKAAARANAELGILREDLAILIIRAAEEVAAGQLDDHFPLSVWISGSGTQCNMNVNEVVANRANELAGVPRGSRQPIHPNDHVNLSQSSNDVFPTAMHVAVVQAVEDLLLPALAELHEALAANAAAWADIVKIGRTHLQDAVPITLGQEFSGYAALLADNRVRLESALAALYEVPLGGTAVGTGFNAPKGFAEKAVWHLAQLTGYPFAPARNCLASQGSHDALVAISGSLRTLAGSLHKIANDIRLLGSGPRAGLHELVLPANEPG